MSTLPLLDDVQDGDGIAHRYGVRGSRFELAIVGDKPTENILLVYKGSTLDGARTDRIRDLFYNKPINAVTARQMAAWLYQEEHGR